MRTDHIERANKGAALLLAELRQTAAQQRFDLDKTERTIRQLEAFADGEASPADPARPDGEDAIPTFLRRPVASEPAAAFRLVDQEDAA